MGVAVKTWLTKRVNPFKEQALWRGAQGRLGLGETLSRAWVKRLPGVFASSFMVTVFLLWIGIQAKILLVILPILGLILVVAILYDG